MRYQIKQKFLSITEKFTIKDEAGRDVLQVEGRLIGSTKTLKDMAGNELAILKRRYLTLRPTFELHVQGKVVAVIRRRLFRLIGAAFDIETATGPVQVEGRIFERNYTLSRAGRPIAQISKAWFSMTDAYGVEIFDEADTVITLAMVLAIDSFLDAKDG
jgi:uncharacterized protein YxjI